MATKQEMEALWDRLSQRLRDDPKLAEVVESIEEALGGAVEPEPRRRLKVPYANTTPMESDGAWK
jgi:hypothetical protein